MYQALRDEHRQIILAGHALIVSDSFESRRVKRTLLHALSEFEQDRGRNAASKHLHDEFGLGEGVRGNDPTAGVSKLDHRAGGKCNIPVGESVCCTLSHHR
ncbi:hypothetical protein ACFS07_33330 [Undibacterium arcticum]